MSPRGECYDVEDVLIPIILVPLSVIGTVACTIIFLCNRNYKSAKSISHLNKSTNSNATLSSKIKRLAVISMMLYSICSLTQFIVIVRELAVGCAGTIIPNLLCIVCYFAAFLCVLSLFTIRIIKTFENTDFAVSKKFIMVYKAMVLCIIIIFIIGGPLRVTGVLSVSQGPQVGIICTSILFVYGLALLRLFVKKLNYVITDFVKQFGKVSQSKLAQLNRSVSVSFDHDPSNSLGGGLSATDKTGADVGGVNRVVNNPQNVQNMRNLTRLISDMSKYTIIVGIAVVSSLLCMIITLIVVDSDVDDSDAVRTKYGLSILSIDCLINCICLILQFEFSKKWYKKICNKCHIKCEDRYTNSTNRQLIRLGSDQYLERLPSREIGLKMDNNNNNNNNKNKSEMPDFAQPNPNSDKKENKNKDDCDSSKNRNKNNNKDNNKNENEKNEKIIGLVAQKSIDSLHV